MRKYYGLALEADKSMRSIYATITGQTDTGQYVYTEVRQDDKGRVTEELVLDNQYIRTLKYGTQLFIRL